MTVDLQLWVTDFVLYERLRCLWIKLLTCLACGNLWLIVVVVLLCWFILLLGVVCGCFVFVYVACYFDVLF